MKLPSKSILSPGRGRDSSQISLSTSLSRRLRNSGSLKGGQASPMFPATATNGKKRGCSFENPEPSSPKVTCIGQVRVKTKKQGKKMRARSRREVSFRRTEQGATNISINSASTNSNCNSHNNLDVNHYQDFVQGHPQECLPHRNQRWVHLPVTICEALRTFGAEFNCFLPCRSSCMASNNKEEKVNHHHHRPNGDANANRSDSSCGAVFARWLVVGGEEERNCSVVEAQDEDDMPRRSQRRHVFEDIVIEGDKCELKNEIFGEEKEKEEEEQEEGRVSICIPPKNALLLMRCRSDPVKMAALANRFWECPPPQEDEAAENEEEEEAEEEVRKTIIEEARIPEAEAEQEAELEAQAQVEAESEGVSEVVQEEEEVEEKEEEEEEEDKQVLDQPAVLEEAAAESDSYTEALPDPDNEQNIAQLVQENENFLEDETEPAPKLEKREAFDDIEDIRPSFSCSSEVFSQQEQESEVAVAEDSAEKREEEEEEEEEEKETETTSERSEPDEPEMGQESKEGESHKENLLPDCLLLMMCEPKLSMEVSKETWVCSTDFIRWQPSEKKPPPQTVNKTDGCDEKPKKRVSVDNATPAPQQQQQQQKQPQLSMQPPRSSCSFPAAPPLPPALGAPSVKTMNIMIEQKLVGAKPSSYEPFALTRCKSEPRKQSAKLAPETCFWKNRKIEPHRPATLGVGAAGVGF
ncbi:hypothetical protein CISIN_1g041472mg [Citrus sinensis]|uniref:Uncharacterized protein n=1 Tax=Citrus sinensis TaxID=2711 RepID=A0A067F4V1_CITSI|nr:hypothetical protein CISIN_1g041472mg [Citrus sinensis]